MNTIRYNNSWKEMSDPVVINSICRYLKQMRLNKNMSQDELSKRSGISRITISRMEAGRAVTLLTLVQVLRALDKLELLNVFIEEPEISPMLLLEQQEHYRKRASSKRAN